MNLICGLLWRTVLTLLMTGAVSGCGHRDPVQRIVFRSEVPLDDVSRPDTVSVLNQRLRLAQLGGSFAVTAVGEDRIEVTTSGADEERVQAIRRLVMQPGTLEFAELANRRIDPDIVDAAEGAVQPVEGNSHTLAEWVPVAQGADGNPKEIGIPNESIQRIREIDGKPVMEYLVLIHPGSRITEALLKEVGEGNQVKVSLWNSLWMTFRSLGQAKPPPPPPAMDLQLTPAGAERMRSMTARLSAPVNDVRGRLALIINGEIMSAPRVHAVISDSMTMEAGWTVAELRALVASLRPGPLPVPLRFEQLTIDRVRNP